MENPVLIADDDDMSILLLKVLVKTSGLASDPLAFLNGKELLDYLTQQDFSGKKPLVLLDINMPVMNGWDFLDAIEKYDVDLNVFIVSSSTNQSDKEQAASFRSVKGFIEKPVRKSDLERLKDYNFMPQYS